MVVKRRKELEVGMEERDRRHEGGGAKLRNGTRPRLGENWRLWSTLSFEFSSELLYEQS